jgi:hypothetical protein
MSKRSLDKRSAVRGSYQTMRSIAMMQNQRRFAPKARPLDDGLRPCPDYAERWRDALAPRGMAAVPPDSASVPGSTAANPALPSPRAMACMLMG